MLRVKIGRVSGVQAGHFEVKESTCQRREKRMCENTNNKSVENSLFVILGLTKFTTLTPQILYLYKIQ